MEDDRKDEKIEVKNEDDNKAMLVWGIILFFIGLPIVGIILIVLYAVKYMKPTLQAVNQNQQDNLANDGGRCPYCGANLDPKSKKCEYCGSTIIKK